MAGQSNEVENYALNFQWTKFVYKKQTNLQQVSNEKLRSSIYKSKRSTKPKILDNFNPYTTPSALARTHLSSKVMTFQLQYCRI